MSRHIIMLLALLSLSACASVVVPTHAGSVARIGEVASVGGVQVRPLRLLEDSRCPALVRCVWAGRLRIEAIIEFSGRSEELRREMTLGEPVMLPQGKLILSAATPAPVAGSVTAVTAYRFTFNLNP